MALALKPTTRLLPPWPLDVTVPKAVPPSLTVVPASVMLPRLPMPSTSCADHLLAMMEAVRLPPLKSAESGSVTVAAVP